MFDHLNQFSCEETPPKAGAMINTFRAFGYNLQTAVADIVDNSISAKAKNVWIQYRWEGSQSWVTISDDGLGMDKEALVEAMTPGSKDPNDVREESDLGRFGLGLKTSSFSQCKALTVVTKQDGTELLKRSWDLDFVNETGKWILLDYIFNEEHQKDLQGRTQGTVVVWEKLDRLVGDAHPSNESAMKVFLEEFEIVEDHLSLVFHRFLESKKLKIFINEVEVEPWDPFMKEASGGQLVAKESLNNDQVKVKCYSLPHISKLSAEERIKAKTDKWYKLQGFYIYRNRRLLLHGDWLGLFSKNEMYKNARIQIEIPNHLDHEWKIDIKKATATPSFAVRKDLVRLGKLTRKQAANIYRFRGNQILLDDSLKSFSFEPIWKARKTRDGARHYFVNSEHSLVKQLLEKQSVSTKDLKTLLGLIGQTIPVESIVQFQNEEPESHELRETEDPEPHTIELAKLLFFNLKTSGLSDELATKQILNIEPFNQYPQLTEIFKKP